MLICLPGRYTSSGIHCWGELMSPWGQTADVAGFSCTCPHTLPFADCCRWIWNVPTKVSICGTTEKWQDLREAGPGGIKLGHWGHILSSPESLQEICNSPICYDGWLTTSAEAMGPAGHRPAVSTFRILQPFDTVPHVQP